MALKRWKISEIHPIGGSQWKSLDDDMVAREATR
jgi:hypothetical protein